MLLLFYTLLDMGFGSVKEKSDVSRLQSLKSFFCNISFFPLLA